MSTSTKPEWVVGTEVDRWGPAVTQPPPQPVSAAPARRRRPWGLGDVLWMIGALVATQFVMVIAAGVVAVANLAPTFNTTAAFGPAEMLAITNEIVNVAKSPSFLVGAMVMQFAVFAGSPWWASRRKGLRSLAKDYGFTFTGKDVAIGLGVAVALQVLMYGFGAAVRATGVDLSGADNTSMVTDHTGLMLAFMIVGAVIAAPLTEELLFRGLVFRAMLRSFAHIDLANDTHWGERHAATLTRTGKAEHSDTRRKVGVVLAVLLSAAFFGVLHTPISDGTTEVTPAAQAMLVFQTGFLGAVFATIAYKAKRMGINVWGHLFFNGISLTLVLTLGG